ncbi:carbon-nitrogen hydrolase, partial [Thozetella sp. PMI_491]
MKIGCLQFAPQVGDVDNNLNRADAVLSRVDPMDLDALDLLVLPELAFTGSNFKSLRQITPHLEPCGAGISALWARTIALKHNCTVSVGYPEKVRSWQTGPEYYNSTILINEEGETLGNYRKSFLSDGDETWALEGKDDFFHGKLPLLGSTAIGICEDIRPEAPWNAFEFGFHVVRVKAELVIVSMAWMACQEGRTFTRQPLEPDMESLTHWVQRLEPVIRTEDDREVIVVFCNRSGSEGDRIYSGTSAVIGIKAGEVLVYGLLGRGHKELLVVDTDKQPFAKLVQKLELHQQEVVFGPPAQQPSAPSSVTSSVVTSP